MCECACAFVPGILVGEIRGNNRTAPSSRQIDNSDRTPPPHRPIALFITVPFSFLLGVGRVEHTPSPSPQAKEPRGRASFSQTSSLRVQHVQHPGPEILARRGGGPGVIVTMQTVGAAHLPLQRTQLPLISSHKGPRRR